MDNPLEAGTTYGYCPQCGAPGNRRERRMNGNYICVNKHTYPSAKALNSPPVEESLKERQDVVLDKLKGHSSPLMKEAVQAYMDAEQKWSDAFRHMLTLLERKTEHEVIDEDPAKVKPENSKS